MHIIVCIKQVPDTANVKINPETNTLMRDGVESIINPFDEYALEEALGLKDKHGAKVSVITMGPPQASVILREALARGADEGILLTDRAFAGADTLATSYTIALAIKKINPHPDLVFFGKQAIDGDTGQVGPGVAECLGIALLGNIKTLEVENGRFRAESVHENGSDILEGDLPCVMTVLKEASSPRFARLRGWMDAKHAPLQKWSAQDIEADPEKLGLKGSATKVVRIFSPPVRGCELKCVWSTDKEVAIKSVMGTLVKKGILE